jgi:hypothetical protein
MGRVGTPEEVALCVLWYFIKILKKFIFNSFQLGSLVARHRSLQVEL